MRHEWSQDVSEEEDIQLMSTFIIPSSKIILDRTFKFLDREKRILELIRSNEISKFQSSNLIIIIPSRLLLF